MYLVEVSKCAQLVVSVGNILYNQSVSSSFDQDLWPCHPLVAEIQEYITFSFWCRFQAYSASVQTLNTK